MRKRTSKQILFDILEILEWAMKHFDGYAPNSATEKKYVLKAVDLGYAESIGMVYQADGEGFILENRRMKEAWKLTDKGIRELKRLRRDQ